MTRMTYYEPATPVLSGYMTTSEYAREAGVSSVTVWRWLRAGRLAGVIQTAHGALIPRQPAPRGRK